MLWCTAWTAIPRLEKRGCSLCIMELEKELARLRVLCDGDLLASLGGALQSSRRSTVATIAHLIEVEQRRLHWIAGQTSMFAYCISRLRMSEDEAYRRIEVARLCKRHPRLFEKLERGELTLSVAALLRKHLTAANADPLLAELAGKTVCQAREVLAGRFPRADVPSSIRKLPERRPTPTPPEAPTPLVAQMTLPDAAKASPGVSCPTSLAFPLGVAHYDPPAANTAAACALPLARASVAAATPAAEAPSAEGDAPVPSGMPDDRASPLLGSLPLPDTPPRARANPTTLSAASLSRATAGRIEPLGPARYRVQLTASAELKRKLDLARDLLRHALPSGDLPAIVERALDLLIEQTLQRRFATRKRATCAPPSPAGPRAAGEGGAPKRSRGADISKPTAAAPPVQHARHIPCAARRAVTQRDGACCSYVAPDGVPCNSRAWLELDHVVPRGQGGTNHPENLRWRCRAHNRLAAEHAYGQQTISRCIARRRRDPPETGPGCERGEQGPNDGSRSSDRNVRPSYPLRCGKAVHVA